MPTTPGPPRAPIIAGRLHSGSSLSRRYFFRQRNIPFQCTVAHALYIAVIGAAEKYILHPFEKDKRLHIRTCSEGSALIASSCDTRTSAKSNFICVLTATMAPYKVCPYYP